MGQTCKTVSLVILCLALAIFPSVPGAGAAPASLPADAAADVGVWPAAAVGVHTTTVPLPASSCWARLNDALPLYDTVQAAVDASTHPTDVVKVAGYCTGAEGRPADVTPTGLLTWTALLPPAGLWTQTVVVTVLPTFTGVLTNTTRAHGVGGGEVAAVCTVTVVRVRYDIYLPLVVKGEASRKALVRH